MMNGNIMIGGQRFFRDYTNGIWRAECEWNSPEVNEYEAPMLTKIERLLVAGDRLAIAGALYDTGIPKYLLDEWEEARRD